MDWNRIGSAVRQLLKSGQPHRGYEEIMAIVRVLHGICGPATQNRQMLIKIARLLANSQRLKIAAPCCPDYSHENGMYTFKGLQGDVSLLAQKHIVFLRTFCNLVSGVEVTLLYADHESRDGELCRAAGKSSVEFEVLVRKSVEKTAAEVSRFGWNVVCMTSCIPDLAGLEAAQADCIARRAEWRQRIETETWQRMEMYCRIRPAMPIAEMRRRTIATAAQYMALGNYAANNRLLLCNHSTVNLSWYLQTGAAVMHNPVSVY